MPLQQDEEDSGLEAQDRKGGTEVFKRPCSETCDLTCLFFWSKDNVVREESMISADSTSPARVAAVDG